MKIEIISGSPRVNSTSLRIAVYLQRTLQQHAGINAGLIDLREHRLPILHEVFKNADAAPLAFRSLAERMFAADAFILVTPEYNGSYSPAMQNLFDHFPKQYRKPFGLATASTGALGGMRAAMQLQQFVLALFGIPSPQMLITPLVDKKFDAAGNLTDEAFQRNIDQFVNEFLWLAGRLAMNPVQAAA